MKDQAHLWMNSRLHRRSYVDSPKIVSLVLLFGMLGGSWSFLSQTKMRPVSSTMLTSHKGSIWRLRTVSMLPPRFSSGVGCQRRRMPTSSIGRMGILAPIRVDSYTRLFGSQRGKPANPLGTISIYNEQSSLTEIDENAIRQTVQRISKILGYETYDVTLLLVDDDEMRETNFETRGINAPTDILSFPFHFHKKPGLLEEPEFDIPDYYTLGDMMVCVPYVIRRCKEDQMQQELNENGDEGVDDGGLGDDDRGVSGALAEIRDPEKRIRMLLVHGMLHLVGYDHEEEDEYIEMVEMEEEILRELGDL